MRTGDRRSSRRTDLKMNAEINVTSLIDVAFTLLVIFIITAPIMQGGIEVRLPQGQVQPLTGNEEPMIINVMEEGTVVIGETPFAADQFEESFPGFFELANPAVVFIRGDSLAPYGRVAPVMSLVGEHAREAGIPWRMIMQERPSQ